MDGSSLAGVETTALTQGVAFLYAQAGEILRRRRDARERAAAARGQKAADSPTGAPVPPLEMPEGVFEPAVDAATTRLPTVPDTVAEDLLQARRAVDDYVMGTASLGPRSPEGLMAADRLRCLLEVIYGAALTFSGEQRQTLPGTATHVGVRHAGVVLSNATVHGDVAGRDITKHG